MEFIYRVPGEKAARIFAYLGFIVLVIMAIWILVDVFSGIFRWGFPGMVDWVEVLNVICIALPLPFVTIRRKHIYMTIIQQRLSISGYRRNHTAALTQINYPLSRDYSFFIFLSCPPPP